MNTVTPRVRLIGWTTCDLAAMSEATGGAWIPDAAAAGSLLAEFAGRACYQSWTKPNPATATNDGYLRHILEVGHLSVLEHGVATFYLTGVSRSFTHELIRHRHLSYSQLSQRYVPARQAAVVEPDVIAADPDLHAIFAKISYDTQTAYQRLLDGMESRLADHRVAGSHQATAYLPPGSGHQETCRECGQPWPCQTARTSAKKQARQAARSVLPNATETRIVVTGNYRAWRHFIGMRATEAADVEIRAVAVDILRSLQTAAPSVFRDFTISRLTDGTDVAESRFVSYS